MARADGSVKFDAMGGNVLRYTLQIFIGERKDVSVLQNNEVAAVVNWGLRFALSSTNLGSSVVPKLRSRSLSCSLCVQYATSIVSLIRVSSTGIVPGEWRNNRSRVFVWSSADINS